MTAEQYQISFIVVMALLLFVWGRLRHDVVAIVMLMICVLLGLVPASEAFSGAGHPAVITVAAVLIISDALKRSGVVDIITVRILNYIDNPFAHVFLLTAIVAIASAFMNNVGALALMLPVALATASKHDRSPAMLLMPLAFGSILGGMMTAIGTPPNIIIASLRAQETGVAFNFFDFSAVGVTIATLGVLFVSLLGWKLLPKARMEKSPPEQLFGISDYLTEVIVPKDSELVESMIEDLVELEKNDIEIIGLSRGHRRPINLPTRYKLKAGDILILQGDPSDIQSALDSYDLALITSGDDDFDKLTSGDLTLAEGVIQPDSVLVGHNVSFLKRLSGGALAMIGLARQGQPIRRRLCHQTFLPGDIMLLQGTRESLETHMPRLGMLPLAERNLNLGLPRHVGLALVIFIAAIALGVADILPLSIAFVAAILAYLFFNILSVHQLYAPIDWSVIVLLLAMIPIGDVLVNTGLTTLLAEHVLGLTASYPLYLTLGLILVVTMFLSDVINNAATAIIMAPIAIDIAKGLNASADPFLMAVAVGASCAFLTPIGHQSNTLVLGPGGYKFGDYWRMGLPLEIIIVTVSIPLILMVWPP